MSPWNVFIDVSEITDMVNADELMMFVEDEIEEMALDILTELQSPPPEGTPVDSGEARNSWQLDTSNKLSPEIYSTSEYMNRLNEGSSTQSPTGFIEIAIDKVTRG